MFITLKEYGSANQSCFIYSRATRRRGVQWRNDNGVRQLYQTNSARSNDMGSSAARAWLHAWRRRRLSLRVRRARIIDGRHLGCGGVAIISIKRGHQHKLLRQAHVLRTWRGARRAGLFGAARHDTARHRGVAAWRGDRRAFGWRLIYIALA